MKFSKSCRTRPRILTSKSGRAKMLVLLLLAAPVSWYWNHRPPTPSGTVSPSVQSPAPAPTESSQPKQEPVYDNAQDYARKNVFFAGVGEGKLPKPGLILKFDNRGDRDISNLSVKIIGYKEFYVQDTSKVSGTEYSVDLEVKSFPAKKVTETVLYFPPGVLSIARNITIDNASF